MRRWRAAAVLGAAIVLAAGLAAGCGHPRASIRYVAGGPDEPVLYQTATFQLGKERKVQFILLRRQAASIGTGDPDFEYVFLELPEREKYGWLKEDGVPAYRWVHEDGRDHVWLGASGQVQMRPDFLSKDHMHLDFRVTMEPIAGTAGGAYVLGGVVKFREDMVYSQGLMNRYGPWLRSLISPKPAAPKPRK